MNRPSKLRCSGAPEFSVVIPCRNEEANVVPMAHAVVSAMEPVSSDFEVIFIDNESADKTVALIKELCASDPRIKLIVNTRNFGQMRSPTYGIFQARGRAVLSLCADFQDPPALLPEFVRRWRAGTDIVLGVRVSEKSPLLFGAIRHLSYRMQRALGDYPIIPDATGFGLYSRRAVEAIKALNEPEPFFRGLLVETGYPIETIPYKRAVRARGRSNNGFFSLLDFALNGLAGSAKGLLRAPLYVAFFFGMLTLVALIGAVIAAFVGRSVQLWLLAGVLEGQFTLLFLFLGLLGVQVGQIAERTRNQPLVLERERVNFTDLDDEIDSASPSASQTV